jgi:hypothetical protein
MNKHERIKAVAKQLKNDGWDVRASNIEGFDPPDMIEGYVPSIVAYKNTHKRIIEIEQKKPKIFNKFIFSKFRFTNKKEKIEAFKKSAQRQSNTTVWVFYAGGKTLQMVS